MGHPLHTAFSGLLPFQVRVFLAIFAETWIRPLSSSLSSPLLSSPFLSSFPLPLSFSLLPVLSSFPLPAVQVGVFFSYFAGTWLDHPLYTALSGISSFQVRVFFFLFAGTWIRPLSSSLSSFLSHHPSPLSFLTIPLLFPFLSSLPFPYISSSFSLPAVQVRVFSAIFAGTWISHPLHTAFSGLLPFQVRVFSAFSAGTWISHPFLFPSLLLSFSLLSPLSLYLFVLFFPPPSRLGWFSYFSSLPGFWKFYFNGKMLRIITVTEVRTEVSESQKEVERILLPFTVDWRARVLFGSTYTISFCCR